MDKEIIQIKEVKNVTQVPNITNVDEFLMKLKLYNIQDITKSDQVQIKKSGDRYIFTIFDEKGNKTDFALRNKGDVETFLTAFYDQQKNQDEYVAVQMSGIESNQLEIIYGTSEEINDLRNEVLTHNAESLNPDRINRRIKTLKEFFDAQRDDSRREAFWLTAKYARSGMERDFWKINRNEAKKRLKDLSNIEKQMKRVEKKPLSSDANVNQELTENELRNISMQLDKLSANVPLFETQSQSLKSGTSDIIPDYKMDIAKMNKPQAKRLLKALKQYNERQKDVTNITMQADKENMKARDMQELQAYLEGVANNTIDPKTTPFDPKWKESYNALIKMDESMQNDYPNLASNNDRNINNQNNSEYNSNNLNFNNQVNNPNNGKVLDANGNWVDVIGTGGFYGGINKLTENWQDKSERGQEFYKNFGNIALLAGGIFLGIKALGATWRIIRGKKKEGDRGWLGGTAGLLLLTAGRPQDLFRGGYASEKFADLLKLIGFGKDKVGGIGSESSQQSPMQSVEQSTTGAMALFNGMKYGDMAKIIETNNDGKMKIKPDVRKSRLDETKEKLPRLSGIEKANAEGKIAFLESVGQNDEKGLLDLALTSMGVNAQALESAPDQSFNNQAQEFIQRSLDLGELMNSKNYQKTNNESDAKISEYMAGRMTLEELENSGAFEKKVNLSPEVQNVLKSQVYALDIEATKKQDLTEAVMQFYQDWNTTDKSSFKIEKDGDNIILSTYGEKTPITLDKKVAGLPVAFDTTKETLRVANLTNRIKSLSRKLKPANNDKPFHIENMTTGSGVGGIAFDNQDRYKVWTTDVTMISTNGIESVSSILSKKENKERYVDYLNGLGHRDGGVSHGETAVIIPTVITNQESQESTQESSQEHTESSGELSEEEKETMDKHLATIDGLKDISTGEKQKIKDAFVKFYKSLGKEHSMGLDLKALEDGLNLSSYGEYKTIDLKNKKLYNLEIKFSSYEDLFRTANLTNNILSITKNRKTSNGDFAPFKLETAFVPLGIGFNDTGLTDFGFDTRIVSGSGLSSVSEKLSQSGNVDIYLEHLNNLWLGEQQNGINSLIVEGVKKQEVLNGFKLFMEKKAKDDNPGEVKFENGKMITRGFSTEINLRDMTILGNIIMDQKDKSKEQSYSDMFELADMINRIKKESRNLGSNTDEPFNISNVGGDIEFDSKQSYTDVEILPYASFTSVNENLDNIDNRRLFRDDLNNWWKSQNK